MRIISKMLVLFLVFSYLLILSTDPVEAYWQYGYDDVEFFTGFDKHGSYYYAVGSFANSSGLLNLVICKINASGSIVEADTVFNFSNDSCAFVFQDKQNNIIIGGNNPQHIPIIAKYNILTGNVISYIRDPIEEGEDTGGGDENNGNEEDDIYAFVGSRKPPSGTWNILVYETTSSLESEGLPEFVIITETNDYGYGIISLDQGEYTGEYLIVGCKEESQYIARININTGQVLDEWVGNVGKFYSVIDGDDGCAWICGYEIMPKTTDKRLVFAQYEISSGRMSYYYSPYGSGVSNIGYDIIKSSNNIFIVGDKIIGSNSSAIVDVFDLTGVYINTYKFDETEVTNGRGICILPNNIYICGCINIEDNIDAFIEFMHIENEKDYRDPNLPMNPDYVLPEVQNTDVSIQLISPLVSDQLVNIQFEIFQKQNIKIRVFDITGSEICCLADQVFDQGTHSVSWEGINNCHQLINTGVYFIQFITDRQTLSEKVIFTR